MVDQTTQYAKLIADGTIISCKKVKQAAKRHLNDLRRANTNDYEYYFDVAKAEEVIRFVSSLPNPTDGNPMKLVNFQAFIVGSIFGWRNKKTTYRKYTRATISMARKQGKTIVVAGIALYMLLYERTPRYDRQIYTAGNSRDQAMLAYNYIKNFLKKLRADSKFVRKNTKVLRSEIRQEESNSYIKPLSADYNTLDGLNALLAIIDEQSRSKDYGLVDVLQTSQGQQKQPLLLIISTVSEMVNAWFHTEEYVYVTKVLNGDEINEHYFALWYEMDDEEEVQDEKNWIKANPILYNKDIAATLLPNIRTDWSKAQATDNPSPALIKYFNIWQSESQASYMNAKDWLNTEIPAEPDLVGRDVYIGLDLARVGDLSAVSWVVPINEEGKFYVDSHAFVGTRGGIDAKIKRDKIDYKRLGKKGFVTLADTSSGMIDDQSILDYIDELVHKYNFNVVAICYDRYSANNIIQRLDEQGYMLVDVAQGFASLSEPTKQFKKFVQDGDIAHAPNELLNIAINNAILKQTNDAVMIDKTMNRNKIDPLAALIDAFYRAFLHDFTGAYMADNEFYEKDFTF